MADLPVPSAPVMVESDETSDVPDVPAVEDIPDTPPTPPQTALPDDESSPESSPVVSDEENACALPLEEASDIKPLDDAVPSTSATPAGMIEVVRQRRAALPYTFHFMTGNNIRLCSSGNMLYFDGRNTSLFQAI